MKVEIIIFGLGYGVFILYFIAFIYTSSKAKRRIINKILMEQEESVRLQKSIPLTTFEYPDTETAFTLLLFFCFLGVFFKACFQLLNGNGWTGFWTYFFAGVLLSILSEIIVFYIRKDAGCIQGAVLFEPREKMYYVFPSITSDYYKEYQESDLLYIIEKGQRKGLEKTPSGVAYVFFTKEEMAYAFKVMAEDSLNDALILRQPPTFTPAPFKYRLYNLIQVIPFLIAIVVCNSVPFLYNLF